MNEAALRRLLGRMNIRDVSRPNMAKWMHTACPFAPFSPAHKNGKDRSKGFAIKVEDDGVSAFNCPVCKNHGTIAHLARSLGKHHKRDYHQIALDADMADLEGLANIPEFEEAHVELPPDPLDEMLYEDIFLDPWNCHNQYPEAAEFLKARGISSETGRKIGLGFDPEKHRITFPVRDIQGQLYGWSGRTTTNHKAKVLDYEGLPKRWLILGQELWVPGKPVLMVEGLFAYAHMHEIGADKVANIGALLGSYLTPEKAGLLKAFDAPVYWFLDPDAAGDDGLFGKEVEITDRKTGEVKKVRDREGSALYMMNGHVPQFVPDFPVDDPDFLTFEQVVDMITRTDMWLPDAV